MAGNVKGTNPNLWIPRCSKCGKVAVKGTNLCKRHGGHRKGITTVDKIKTGKFSKTLQRIADKDVIQTYENGENDPHRLELNDEIDAVNALEQLIFSKIDTDIGKSYLTTIVKQYESIIDARRKGNAQLANELFFELGDKLDKVQGQLALMDEWLKLVSTKQKLTESQSKRDIQLDQVMRAEDVLILFKAIMNDTQEILYGRLPEPELARDILSEIAQKAAGHISRDNSRRTLKT